GCQHGNSISQQTSQSQSGQSHNHSGHYILPDLIYVIEQDRSDSVQKRQGKCICPEQMMKRLGLPENHNDHSQQNRQNHRCRRLYFCVFFYSLIKAFWSFSFLGHSAFLLLILIRGHTDTFWLTVNLLYSLLAFRIPLFSGEISASIQVIR